MNNGVFTQNLLDKPSSDIGLPKGLPGINPVALPYSYPGDDNWRIDKTKIVLVFDTRYGTNTSITIPPIAGSNLVVDWGDGTVRPYGLGTTYTYANHGIYIVQISGQSTSMGNISSTEPNRIKLIKCLSFGNTITSLAYAFSNPSVVGHINLIEAPESLPPNCTTLFVAFAGCWQFNDYKIRNWNTSRVTDMNTMFIAAFAFNQPLNNWDVSKVTNFSQMFQQAANFNGSLSGWQLVANNVNCASMFQQAIAFNQDINNWNTSGVTNMSSMFYGTYSFNQPLDNWNTSNVTNMNSMFFGFIQPNIFNQNIGSWNVGKVTNMVRMFIDARSFNNGGSDTINNWNVSKVVSMYEMFRNAYAFNQPLTNWNLCGLNSADSLDFFMFGKTGSNSYSTANYDALLIGWNNNKLATENGVANWRTDLRPNFGGAKYTAGGAAATARAALVSYGWTITDGGVA